MTMSKTQANIRDRRRPLEDLEKAEDSTAPKVPKHDEKIRQVADQYASSKGLKLQHDLPPVKVNPERAKKIASAYASMTHNPDHADVKESYNALINETSDQLHHIKNAGMKFSKIKPGQENPYKNGSKDLLHDVRNNGHMWYYPTESGFGSKDNVFGPSGHDKHPMLTPTGHKDEEGNAMPANDVFRIVHDYFGHAKEGHGFGANGEEGAWRHHKQMFSPTAQRALTSETRGQNSWVNFGPHGEHNKKNPAQTIYADQKAGLLPDWAHDDSDAPKAFGKSEMFKSIKPEAKPAETPKTNHRAKVGKDHFLFSAENPKYPEKNKAKLTHEQALEHLKNNGFDAHSVNGHYGAPERSIIVYGVKGHHAKTLHHLASTLGQESSIHSNGEQHQMKFHHGPHAGKSMTGKGTTWHDKQPTDNYTSLPDGHGHFTHKFDEQIKSEAAQSLPLAKGEDNIQAEYKKNARSQCGISFPVKVKGRSKLSDEIKLHMSLKCFNSKDEFKIPEVIEVAKELGIDKPDLKGATFKPTIFTNEKTKNTYYMLIIEGLDPKYKKFCDHFKDVGVTHAKFMSHITIDKALYDQIKKEGIKADELEFSGLILEHGAGNRLHTFEKSEVLEKGPIKNTLAALGVAGSMAATTARDTASASTHSPQAQVSQQRAPASAPKMSPYDHKRMLDTISAVESNHGKYQNHKELSGIHHGESAFGKYGLTPVVVRETVHLNHDLQSKHKKLLALRGDDLHRYMEDNPGLEDTIADKHLQRLEHHFGQEPGTLGYAWLNGVQGTYKAKKDNKDIANHWHAKKIISAYSEGK